MEIFLRMNKRKFVNRLRTGSWSKRDRPNGGVIVLPLLNTLEKLEAHEI